MSSEVVTEFSIHLERVDGYEFRVRFDKPQYAELMLDEPAPLGADSAPNAVRLLAAAVGNCLAASLLFCLSRAGSKPEAIRAEVRVQLTRNEKKRLRIGSVDVVLRPRLGQGPDALTKCLDTFEDFCVVTQSVRQGLDVRVRVEPES